MSHWCDTCHGITTGGSPCAPEEPDYTVSCDVCGVDFECMDGGPDYNCGEHSEQLQSAYDVMMLAGDAASWVRSSLCWKSDLPETNRQRTADALDVMVQAARDHYRLLLAYEQDGAPVEQ